MGDRFWLSNVEMARLEPFFSKSHGKPRVDNRRVLRGIIFINGNGLRWRDALKPMARTRRWRRWGEKGIFAQMLAGLTVVHDERKTVMIDATYLKAHRTATTWPPKVGRSSD